MENKEYKVYGNTITRNLSELAEPTGNIYESTMIIAKGANQIAAVTGSNSCGQMRISSVRQNTATLITQDASRHSTVSHRAQWFFFT